MAASPSRDLDESLYSRQLYVLGHDAMRRMASSDVLISGLGGLGVEVAKNVILSGVRSVTLHDEGTCTLADLASQFYLDENDLGKSRAEVSLPQLSELNAYVSTRSYTAPLNKDFIMGFSVVVLADVPVGEHLWISEVTHANNIALIIAETRGLFARIFCDFGKEFTVFDKNGENPSSSIISSISNDKDGVVTCLHDTQHSLETGDYVTFTEVEGMIELNSSQPRQVVVISPYSFSIGDTSNYSQYTKGGIVTQVKMPIQMQFKRLRDSVMAPEFLVTNFAKPGRPEQLHLAFETLNKFLALKRQLPQSWCHKHAAIFISLAKASYLESGNLTQTDDVLLEIFSKVCRGTLGPITATIGGIAAQEVLKACSGKFTPICQWLYFDAVECLPAVLQTLNMEECAENRNRYDGQTAVFGRKFQNRLGSLKCFVVGAGAIGGELLKNLAMMGVGGNEGGLVIVTDMDLIEKSNLNRQFLFRPSDLRSSKSLTAASAVRVMNPAMNVIAYEERVAPETEEVFNDEFYESLDVVVNALDNIPARVYMDRRCVFYHKPMLDSGTLGTKGNTQVVIPLITESYASSRDEPEKDIPMCTLKNFPHAIEHTLQWARDCFEGIFSRAAENAKKYLTDPDFLDRILKLPPIQSLEILEALKKDLVDKRPHTFEDCVEWARCYWQDQFSNQIQQLLFNFPGCHVTSSGQPFWSGQKRCPVPLTFSQDIPLHLDFIFAAANLKAQVYGIPQNRDRSSIVRILENVSIPAFSPKTGVNIAETDSQLDSSNEDVDEKVARFYKDLPSKDDLGKTLHITSLEFEKDDDTNLHIDFIVAASNLRAENYRIPPADRLTSKMIAGKIIPAIATTTSVVAGLVCLELYKLAQGHENVSLYKNGFVNLALPFIGFSEPIAAPKFKYNTEEWNLWSRFDVHGEMTLREFINFFKDTHKLDVNLVSQEANLLYSTFMTKEKCLERLKMTISELVENVSKKKIPTHVKTLMLEIGCEDEMGEDVEVPYVRYTLCPKRRVKCSLESSRGMTESPEGHNTEDLNSPW